MRVQGKSIIVTGAGGGIGEGIARRLAEEGASVIVNDINAALGEKVVAEIAQAGGKASFFAADVTKSAVVLAPVEAAVQRHGKLDAMVNNAGWTHRNRPALEVGEDEFDKCYAVNMKSIYLSTIHAVPAFRANKGGSFINIASTGGRVGSVSNASIYSGTKGAIVMFSKSIAREVAADGILVNCVAPGTMDTDLMRNLSPEQLKAITDQVPLKRLGHPEEVARLVAFMASDAFGYATGATYDINGGWVML